MLHAGFSFGLPFNHEDVGEISVDFHIELCHIIPQSSSKLIRISAGRNDIHEEKAVKKIMMDSAATTDRLTVLNSLVPSGTQGSCEASPSFHLVFQCLNLSPGLSHLLFPPILSSSKFSSVVLSF